MLVAPHTHTVWNQQRSRHRVVCSATIANDTNIGVDTVSAVSGVHLSQVFDDDTSMTLSNPSPMSVGVYRSVSSMLNRSRTSCGFGVSTLSEGKHTGALALRGVSPVLGMMTSSQSDTSMLMWLLSLNSVSTMVLRFGSEPCTLP